MCCSTDPSNEEHHTASDEVSAGAFSLAKSLFNKHLLQRLNYADLSRVATDEALDTAMVTQHIVLLGDSVSSQLAQFLICDLSRDIDRHGDFNRRRHSDHPSPRWSTNSTSSRVVRAFNRSTASFMVPLSFASSSIHHENRIGHLLVHNQQFNLPCVHNNRSGR